MLWFHIPWWLTGRIALWCGLERSSKSHGPWIMKLICRHWAGVGDRKIGIKDFYKRVNTHSEHRLTGKPGMDCVVHGVAKSWTRLSDFPFHFHFIFLPFHFLGWLPCKGASDTRNVNIMQSKLMCVCVCERERDKCRRNRNSVLPIPLILNPSLINPQRCVFRWVIGRLQRVWTVFW